MLIFEEFSALAKQVANSVNFRADGQVTSAHRGVANPIGWFRNSSNISGWTITKLDTHDVQWLKSANVPMDKMFRVHSSNGTNVAFIDVKSGTYAFIDNVHYEATDEVKLQKKTKFSKLYIDGSVDARKAFGVK